MLFKGARKTDSVLTETDRKTDIQTDGKRDRQSENPRMSMKHLGGFDAVRRSLFCSLFFLLWSEAWSFCCCSCSFLRSLSCTGSCRRQAHYFRPLSTHRRRVMNDLTQRACDLRWHSKVCRWPKTNMFPMQSITHFQWSASGVTNLSCLIEFYTSKSALVYDPKGMETRN